MYVKPRFPLARAGFVLVGGRQCTSLNWILSLSLSTRSFSLVWVTLNSPTTPPPSSRVCARFVHLHISLASRPHVTWLRAPPAAHT